MNKSKHTYSIQLNVHNFVALNHFEASFFCFDQRPRENVAANTFAVENEAGESSM